MQQDLYDAAALLKAGFSVDIRGKVVKVGADTAKKQAWI